MADRATLAVPTGMAVEIACEMPDGRTQVVMVGPLHSRIGLGLVEPEGRAFVGLTYDKTRELIAELQALLPPVEVQQ